MFQDGLVVDRGTNIPRTIRITTLRQAFLMATPKAEVHSIRHDSHATSLLSGLIGLFMNGAMPAAEFKKINDHELQALGDQNSTRAAR